MILKNDADVPVNVLVNIPETQRKKLDLTAHNVKIGVWTVLSKTVIKF